MTFFERFQDRGRIYRNLLSRRRSQIRKARDYYQYGKSAFSRNNSPPIDNSCYTIKIVIEDLLLAGQGKSLPERQKLLMIAAYVIRFQMRATLWKN
jgi:hypothetical protein